MPPSRRTPRTPTPPVRRPRVAGSRRPGTQRAEPAEPGLGLDSDPVEPPAEIIDEDAEYADATAAVRGSVIGAEPEDLEDSDPADSEREYSDLADSGVDSDAGAGGDSDTDAEPVDPPSPRPTGKRRWTGVTRLDDLAVEEAALADHRAEPAVRRPRRGGPMVWAVTLTVLAVILAGLAVWFRGEANSLSEGADVSNTALTDPATASEAVRQLREAIEKTLSYNYTDLDSTAKAVRENLAGNAVCEYEQLFGEVRKLAPEQKIVVTAQVREIGISRLQGDQALLLVFVDQRSTRADQNQTAVSGAQFNIHAERQQGQWKIVEFDLLGQPLANGKPAPQC